MPSNLKKNKGTRVKIYDLINKTKLFNIARANPTHAHAIFTIVTMLHEHDYEVNWDTQHLPSLSFRNENIPLYLREAKTNNRIRADIVFALDKKTLVALEVSVWNKQKLTKTQQQKIVQALERIRESKQ